MKTDLYDEWTNATALQKNEVSERCCQVLGAAQSSSVFHYHFKAFLDYCSREDHEAMLRSALQTVELIVHCLCEDLHDKVKNNSSEEVGNPLPLLKPKLKKGQLFSILKFLSVISDFSPKSLTFHLHLLEMCLKPRAPEKPQADLQLQQMIIEMIRKAIPVVEYPDQKLFSDIENDLMISLAKGSQAVSQSNPNYAKLTQFGLQVISSAIACLVSSVAKITHNYYVVSNILNTCLSELFLLKSNLELNLVCQPLFKRARRPTDRDQ
jgi:hypothetical protein